MLSAVLKNTLTGLVKKDLVSSLPSSSLSPNTNYKQVLQLLGIRRLWGGFLKLLVKLKVLLK